MSFPLEKLTSAEGRELLASLRSIRKELERVLETLAAVDERVRDSDDA